MIDAMFINQMYELWSMLGEVFNRWNDINRKYRDESNIDNHFHIVLISVFMVNNNKRF